MIPFVDLRTQYSKIGAQIEAAVIQVLRSGQYILGPEVLELESRLASFAGAKHAVTCASGTDALLIALMARNIGPGDAVFTTPFTFFATAEVIALLGATPVFVDIDPATFNIDPRALERAIAALRDNDPRTYPLPRNGATPLKPQVVMPVDLFGLPADYDAIADVARRHDLLVIADAAQSFGGEYKGRRVGNLAEVTATSFFPAKPLGACGDGGALFTDDAGLDEVYRSIRVHGQGSDRYENVRLGITGRLDAIQAAVLMAKLTIFPEELEQRQRVADTYTNAIEARNVSVVPPGVPQGYISAWAQYSLLADDSRHRQAIIDSLKAAGVPTAIYYPKSLHMQTALAGLGYRVGDFPASEDASSRIFSVPMHPYLDEATIVRIIETMAAA